MENTLSENQFAVIVTSLLIAARSKLMTAQKCKDEDNENYTSYAQQAKDRIHLCRYISFGRNAPSELNEQMVSVLEKYADICAERGIV